MKTKTGYMATDDVPSVGAAHDPAFYEAFDQAIASLASGHVDAQALRVLQRAHHTHADVPPLAQRDPITTPKPKQTTQNVGTQKVANVHRQFQARRIVEMPSSQQSQPIPVSRDISAQTTTSASDEKSSASPFFRIGQHELFGLHPAEEKTRIASHDALPVAAQIFAADTPQATRAQVQHKDSAVPQTYAAVSHHKERPAEIHKKTIARVSEQRETQPATLETTPQTQIAQKKTNSHAQIVLRAARRAHVPPLRVETKKENIPTKDLRGVLPNKTATKDVPQKKVRQPYTPNVPRDIVSHRVQDNKKMLAQRSFVRARNTVARHGVHAPIAAPIVYELGRPVSAARAMSGTPVVAAAPRAVLRALTTPTAKKLVEVQSGDARDIPYDLTALRRERSIVPQKQKDAADVLRAQPHAQERAHAVVGSATFHAPHAIQAEAQRSVAAMAARVRAAAQAYQQEQQHVQASQEQMLSRTHSSEHVVQKRAPSPDAIQKKDFTHREPRAPRRRGLYRASAAIAVHSWHTRCKKIFSFPIMILLIGACALFGVAVWRYGTAVEKQVTTMMHMGMRNLRSAISSAESQNFSQSQQSFRDAAMHFEKAQTSFAAINSGVVALSQYVPFLSKLSSGKNALDAGEHIAKAGTALTYAANVLSASTDTSSGQQSLLTLYQKFAAHILVAEEELQSAHDAVQKIAPTDVPAAQQEEFAMLQQKLPIALTALSQFRESNAVITDILGANGPRKYLFLFQNNHEMRATGGFIGSYGRLDMRDGKIAQFFIDGIFNPDGQLIDKIIPPQPIQKISAAWSLHDSNWFPDFPTSAEEAITFYERTGGPTVDGVVAITPVVLQRLLEITGPVTLPQYNTTITSENFMEQLQMEVEVLYDKKNNTPKKILSDMAPILLQRIFDNKDAATMKRVSDLLTDLLAERHILLYARNRDLQTWITHAGWGGDITQTDGDYLSVVNTNINGFKTDGVVDETISHWARIQKDGSIIDTVRIVRRHNGGHTPYEWWNKVNANYMRVYVPEGSQLISVSGQTREFVQAPLDYTALGFQADPRVVAEEQHMTIDDATGTRIYTQNGKTVFANWVYVSPQETVTIEYTYKLPFRLSIAEENTEENVADTYKIIFQKQAGSPGSTLVSSIELPASLRSVWHYPQDAVDDQWRTDLRRDRLRGIVLTPR